MIEPTSADKKYYILESAVFIILGLLAIALPGLFTFSIEIFLGSILLVGGIIQAFRIFKVSNFNDSIGMLVMSVASIILGLLLLAYPITGIIALTLLIAILFLIEGVSQIYLGLKAHSIRGSGWIIFSGIISLFLAGLIFTELPGSAGWVLGLLLGINMLVFGISQLLFVTNINKI